MKAAKTSSTSSTGMERTISKMRVRIFFIVRLYAIVYST
jgi:hypothetical protein